MECCKMRVWASGDMEDCGSAPTIGNTGLCKTHLKYCLDNLSAAIADAEKTVRARQAEFDRLYAEFERSELPLLAKVL